MTTSTTDPDPEPGTVERTGVLADDPSAAPAAVERRDEALARLMAVTSPSLALLVRRAALTDGVALTHRIPTDAVSLAELRAAGPLRAGHVLTVALAVSDALVDLAAAGLAHVGLSAEDVLVGPDGTVVLAGCGLAWRRAPGDPEGPRVVDDVAAAGELVRDLLGSGSSPSALVMAALRASDPDVPLRPSPAELHALLRRAGRADPLLELLWRDSRRGLSPRGELRRAPVSTAVPGNDSRVPADVEAEASPPRPARLRIDPRTSPEQEDDDTEPPGVRVSEVRVGRPTGAVASGAGRVPRPERRATTVRVDGVGARGDGGRAGGGRAGGGRRHRSRRSMSSGGAHRELRGRLAWGAVTLLAVLTLAAVRVGALAMADTTTVPRGSGPRAATSPGSASGSTDAESTAPRSTDGTREPAAVMAPGSSARGSVPAGPFDLDRTSAAVAPDWSGVLAAVDAGRRSALAAGDTGALGEWVDPTGPAWASDAALAVRVAAAKARLEGGALVVLDVRPGRVTATEAVLLVHDRRDPYSVTTDAGTTSVAARAARWWQVTLRRASVDDSATWRIRDVVPTGAPAT